MLSMKRPHCLTILLQGMMKLPCAESQIDILASNTANGSRRGYEAMAIDCEMVGGGSNGSLDLCARACLVDEDEKILFHTYVLPQIPVTDYRYLYYITCSFFHNIWFRVA